MLIKLVCFIIGLIVGMSLVIVASCLIISSEESRKEERNENGKANIIS